MPIEHSAKPEQQKTPLTIPLLVGSLMFMLMLDSTVMTTVLPVIARSMGIDSVRLNLAITSYFLSLAVFIPISGWLADRFGTRTIFQISVLVFITGSALSGLSESLWQLVASRIIQGIGGAMMMPVGRLIVLQSTPKSDLVRAFSYLALPALLGPAIGPPLGGFIATYSSWHWIFFINVPIGLIGMALIAHYIRDTHTIKPRPLDWLGFLLMGIGFAALLISLEAIAQPILPIWIVMALVILGTISLVAFYFHAKRCAHPIVDFSLMVIPSFRVALIGGLLYRTCLGATPFLLAMMFQVVFGMTVLATGLLTFAGAAGALLMKTAAAPIMHRYGFRNVLLINTVISLAYFMICIALVPGITPYWLIVLILLLGGFFRSLHMTAINTLYFVDINSEMLARASSLTSLAQQLSASMGVSIAAFVLHISKTLGQRDSLAIVDMIWAFGVITVIALCSLLYFFTLPKDVGNSVSKHRT